ncbi:MAG: hypothetical protein Q4C61_08885 [Lachnospiraceae bacterium]|nr:hypothetical protein [Lachnospiraceae bacterium]
MKKCIIIPASYKGTLSAVQICGIMKKAVQPIYLRCKRVPVVAVVGSIGDSAKKLEKTMDSILRLYKISSLS